MKNYCSFLIFTFAFVSTIYSQSTENFIRIIGNANHTYESDITRVYFSVSEIAPNEYKKISYKPLEDSYSEFVMKLQEIGINENKIIQTNSELSKYNKTKTKYYFVDVEDNKQLNPLSGLQDDGFKVKEIKYLYKNIDPEIETRLSFSAIKDAKRKAQRICSEIDMTLGKILNIEDKSSGCCNFIKESRESETTKKYNITITFELLDK